MTEWYKDWFESNEYLLLYKHRDDTEAKALLELLCGKIKLRKGTSLLDIACGAGRHSLVFAENGFDVTAFDISRNLLKIARGKACSSGNAINLYCADIRNFATKKKYEIILNLFTSFGYFDSDCENFALFENAYNHLNDSGHFVFDYFNVNYLRNNLIPETVDIVEGRKIVQKRYFTDNNRVNKNIIITDMLGGVRFHESVRLYSADVIIQRLEMAGFLIKEIFGNYDGSCFDKDSSHRLLIIAQK